MAALTTWIFPDTRPDQGDLVSLLPLFSGVVYLCPVENDAENTAPECAPFLAENDSGSGLCRLRTPVPLGEDRDRFMRLINDLAGRRDDYAAQLGRLTLASLSAGYTGMAESGTSILSRLLRSQGLTDGRGEKKRLLLWQARLVLKLGELLRRERGELHRKMRAIKRQEENLFSELKEDEPENPFSTTRSLISETPEPETAPDLELKAWARLFAAGPSSGEETILTSHHAEAVTGMSEEYRLFSGIAPQPLLSISLPGRNSRVDAGEYLRQRERFVSENKSLIEALHKRITTAAPRDDADGGWEEELEKFFPAAGYGRCRLSLSRCGGISAAALLLRSFGRDGDDRILSGQGEATENRSGTTILGLLEDD